MFFFFFFQAEDGIRDWSVTGVQTCALPIWAERGSVVDDVEPRIREILQAVPTMPATVIAERIGWDRSIRVLRDRVAELRPVYLRPDPSRDAVAGAHDGLRLLPHGRGGADPLPHRGGPDGRMVAADRLTRRGAAGAGLGR